MIRIQITEDALRDLNEGFLFYEAQASGLGDYFATALRTDIERLKISAATHPIVYSDYHRALSVLFPYGIFYTLADNSAIVWAVVDLRRDPAWIAQRLNE